MEVDWEGGSVTAGEEWKEWGGDARVQGGVKSLRERWTESGAQAELTTRPTGTFPSSVHLN